MVLLMSASKPQVTAALEKFAQMAQDEVSVLRLSQIPVVCLSRLG